MGTLILLLSFTGSLPSSLTADAHSWTSARPPSAYAFAALTALGDSVAWDAFLTAREVSAGEAAILRVTDRSVARIPLSGRGAATLRLRGLHRCARLRDPWPESVSVRLEGEGGPRDAVSLVLVGGEAAPGALVQLGPGDVLQLRTVRVGRTVVSETLSIDGRERLELRRNDRDAVTVCES